MRMKSVGNGRRTLTGDAFRDRAVVLRGTGCRNKRGEDLIVFVLARFECCHRKTHRALSLWKETRLDSYCQGRHSPVCLCNRHHVHLRLRMARSYLIHCDTLKPQRMVDGNASFINDSVAAAAIENREIGIELIDAAIRTIVDGEIFQS